MRDRVDALEIRARQLPYISMDCRDPAGRVAPEGAVLVELAVHTDHVMARGAQ